MEKHLLDAVRRFCRSIELCNGYLRGFYGLKMVSLDGNNNPFKYNMTLTTYRPLIDFWKPPTKIASVNRVRKKLQGVVTLLVFH